MLLADGTGRVPALPVLRVALRGFQGGKTSLKSNREDRLVCQLEQSIVLLAELGDQVLPAALVEEGLVGDDIWQIHKNENVEEVTF